MRRERVLLTVIGPRSEGIAYSYDARNSMGDSLPWDGYMYSKMATGFEASLSPWWFVGQPFGSEPNGWQHDFFEGE